VPDGRTLITGAGGFIGSHLVRRLLAENRPVHLIVRPTTALDRLPPAGGKLRVHRVDLCDRAEVQRQILSISPRRVFHLAANTRLRRLPDEAAAPNHEQYLRPAVNLLEALATLDDPPEVFVRAGTIAEYGRARLPYSECSRPDPVTAYGCGMLATTKHIATLARHLAFPTVTARLALCYGSGQARTFLIPALIDACLSRRPITVRRPLDRRDLMHVDDAVDALICLARAVPKGCDVINICTGVAPTMATVATLIERLTDCSPGIVELAVTEPEEHSEELRCDPGLARKLLGWESRVDLATGLLRTIRAERGQRIESLNS
jgi:dTDP-glucose 4,6-dehydratase/UDP-glucose 4-epimerase